MLLNCIPLLVVFSALVNLIAITGPHDQITCYYTTHRSAALAYFKYQWQMLKGVEPFGMVTAEVDQMCNHWPQFYLWFYDHHKVKSNTLRLMTNFPLDWRIQSENALCCH
jgi:hypothetical protein